MENSHEMRWFNFYFTILTVFLIATSSCSSEQVAPNSTSHNQEQKITKRDGGDCSQCPLIVKSRVSLYYVIPMNQILTCDYYGPTEGGCEYHLTYSGIGPSVYIIGDCNDPI